MSFQSLDSVTFNGLAKVSDVLLEIHVDRWKFLTIVLLLVYFESRVIQGACKESLRRTLKYRVWISSLHEVLKSWTKAPHDKMCFKSSGKLFAHFIELNTIIVVLWLKVYEFLEVQALYSVIKGSGEHESWINKKKRATVTRPVDQWVNCVSEQFLFKLKNISKTLSQSFKADF